MADKINILFNLNHSFHHSLEENWTGVNTFVLIQCVAKNSEKQLQAIVKTCFFVKGIVGKSLNGCYEDNQVFTTFQTG